MGVTRDEIVAVARTYLGTPFHLQGRKKGVGIDCSGLIVCVAKELGIPMLDRDEIARHKMSNNSCAILRRLEAQCKKVETHQPGDILTLWVNPHTKCVAHLGISTGRGIIHAITTARSVIEQPLIGILSQRVSGAYTYPGVE